MSIQFLLDTNVVSEPFRLQPNSRVLENLKQHKDELAISSIVWHELLVGCYRLPVSKKRTALEICIKEMQLPILPYDEEAALWHAAERARLTAQGKTPVYADSQIAAVAATRNLVLVTFNTSDFQHFDGLLLADWRI